MIVGTKHILCSNCIHLAQLIHANLPDLTVGGGLAHETTSSYNNSDGNPENGV